MATDAQIKANKENAQKSTGPKTLEGKQKSSMNATTHGIFAQIPALPGEDQEFLKAIADDIYNTYKPQDAMEVILVERITIAYFKQVRLRAAEDAYIKINMNEDRLTHSLNMALEVPYLDRFTFEDLTPEKEEYYQNLLKVAEEFKMQDEAYKDFSVEMIEKNMPFTFRLLKYKPIEYKGTWEIFITRPDSISLAMKEIKQSVTNYLEKNKFAHTAFYLWEEIKTMQRLPKGIEMDLFNKYQKQFDNDFYRAMKTFQEYRNNRAKLIESEVIEELTA